MTPSHQRIVTGLLLLLLLGAFNLQRPRIFVLHSRGVESSWVRGVDRGLRQVLATNRIPVGVEWHYLGREANHPSNGVSTVLADARRAIRSMDPHIIIAVDDEANAFLARERPGGGGTRILYVSIDRDPEAYGYPTARWVTGISERLSLSAIKEAIGIIRPGRVLSIRVVGARSQTGLGEFEQVREFDWTPHRLVETSEVEDFEALQDAVRRAADGILLVLNCSPLPRRSGGWVATREIVDEIQRNSMALPVAMDVDFVANGGDIAFVPPPEANGVLAMTMGLDWINDLRSDAPPPPARTMSHFDVSLRLSRLRVRGIDIPRIYIEAARNSGQLYP